MRLRLIFVFLASSLMLSAAPAVEQSLGQNLAYLRIHQLPGDLPNASVPRKGSLVLDLRFVSADQDAAAAFEAWLNFQSRPTTTTIVLINAQTAPALLSALAPDNVPARVVTVGPAADTIKPDIALKLPDGADRAAYDALEHGTPLDSLVARKIDKPRHDEAAAVKERAGGDASDAATDGPDESVPAEPGSAATPTPTPVPVPLDAVLQRAVQLHRALLALRKI